MKFLNRYNDISNGFAITSEPRLSSKPALILWNEDLAKNLTIPIDKSEAVELLSGNRLCPDTTPVALAYSGHQFGHFNPTLGDGRAHLLGAFISEQGQLFDIQLKGSGRTPFSRGGDGLCALGPAVREFVMSQAIGALGVPTTHCLAVITTGDSVFREQVLDGAVVSRVANSHIRFGSFQYLALKRDKQGMQNLMEHAITSHYPDIKETGDARVVAFLNAVCDKQIALVNHWIRVGFIHGVMNTDNTLVNGDTIDYGPCAMLEAFDFNQVYSSIDRQGRYAFGNQPNIVNWNCARLAESLLIIMDSDEGIALNMLKSVIDTLPDKFNQAHQIMWANKLGILEWHSSDGELLSELLTLMKEHKLDYTNTFAALTNSIMASPSDVLYVPEVIESWYKKWHLRITDTDITKVVKVMSRVNPAVVPRNQLIEKVIEQFTEEGDSILLKQWLKVLKNPYNYEQLSGEFVEPLFSGANYSTFCGT
jgi:uncharacterized protein YdiU (UPF0061 family)